MEESRIVKGTILYGTRDVRFEDRPDPRIVEPTDAILCISAACVCGSDLWPDRGIAPVTGPTPMGHEYVGIVGVTHGVELSGMDLFWSTVHLHGGPAPVRRYLPDLIDRIWNGKISPGKVFDLTLPLDRVAEGSRAMDERRAIKALLRP